MARQDPDMAQFAGVNPQLIAALGQLMPTLFGTRKGTAETVTSALSPQAAGHTEAILAQLLPQITGTAHADRVVQNLFTRAQQQMPGILTQLNQGGYNSTIGQLMIQELMARAIGESSAAVLQSQQQAAQTAAQLTAATQANTRTQARNVAERTQGQAAPLGTALAALSLIQQGRRVLGGQGGRGGEDERRRAPTGRIPGGLAGMGAASPSIANALPANLIESLVFANPANILSTAGAAAGPISSVVFNPVAAPSVGMGLELLGGGLNFLSDFGIGSGLGAAADFGLGSLADFGFGAASAAPASAFAPAAFDFASVFGGEFVDDAIGAVAGQAGVDFGLGSLIPYAGPAITAINLLADPIEDLDIPLISNVAGAAGDVVRGFTGGISGFVGDVFDGVGSLVGTHICTALYKMGEMTPAIYRAGLRNSVQLDPVVKHGYQLWAKQFADNMMQKRGWRLFIAKLLMGARAKYIAHKYYPRQFKETSALGYLVDCIGRAVCKQIGRYHLWVNSKNELETA